MRDILDPVKPSELRKAFRSIHSCAQRGKVLEDFAPSDDRYLLSIDGTGLYSSTKVYARSVVSRNTVMVKPSTTISRWWLCRTS